ncbi:MAG: hypothetical protein WBQ59_04850 [Candidatus Acidiferrum sp.]
MDSRIASQCTRKKFVRIMRLQVDAGKHQPAAAHADEPESFLRIARGNGFISHIKDEGAERVALGRVIVKNAGRKGRAWGGDFDGFVGSGSHAKKTGNNCAKYDGECFEKASIDK